MTFANTLSLRFLSVGAVLVLSGLTTSGCQQPVPGQFNNGATGAAAGAGAKGTASKTKAGTGNTATNTAAKGQGTMAGTAGAGAAKGGDMADEGGMDSAAAGGSAKAGGAAGAGPATAAKNAKAVPACDGKADEYACDERTLYHCVNGAYEGTPKSCKTPAQCTAGLTTGQCGMCDPGTFMCSDVELQSCDDTGTYVTAMECASAKLCKAEMGICDTQVCHDGEYHCNGDQLQICNRDLSDFEDSGPACEAGLCSATQMGCLECMPGSAPTCGDERTIKSCTDKGMLDQKPCGTDAPYCADGKCVQCNMPTDCGMAMNDCGTMTCTDNKCVAGDPKPQGTACSSNGGKLCDFTGNCVTCVTDLDCKDSTKRCFLGMQCVTKDAITATPLLNSWSVTVSPGFSAIVTPPGGGLQATGTNGNTLNSSQAIDVTSLVGVNNSTYSACGFLQVASGDGDTIRLGFQMAMMGDDQNPIPRCTDAVITLTAKAN